MEDVLEVYCRPHDPKRPVVCLDETFKQLIGQSREPLPARPGAAERHDHVYVRNGVASLFLACEPLAGWRHVAATDHRRRVDWAHFVRDLLDGRYRDAERVVLVMDQLNTHSLASLYEAFPPAEAKCLAVCSGDQGGCRIASPGTAPGQPCFASPECSRCLIPRSPFPAPPPCRPTPSRTPACAPPHAAIP